VKAILLAALVAASTTSAFAADVGVSVSIGQPGFYGQIDIGDYPRPQLIYMEPRMIERGYDNRPPIYMHVPPGHAKHWDKHCHEYHACGERVYFVQDNWYNHEYIPRYRERHGDHHDYRRDGQHQYEDSRNDGHGDDYNNGNGNRNGHGNGNGNDHGH
jgi:hypothetical protein